MASAGAAGRLLNYYNQIVEFGCPINKTHEGITVEIPLNLTPLMDAWHYLGIVVAEVKGDGLELDRAVRYDACTNNMHILKCD